MGVASRAGEGQEYAEKHGIHAAFWFLRSAARVPDIDDPQDLSGVQIDGGSHPRCIASPGPGGSVAKEQHGPVAVFINTEHQRCQGVGIGAAAGPRNPERVDEPS